MNGYIKIEPLKEDSFMVSEKNSYEEIGTVIAVDQGSVNIPVGAKVYFDSFMAKKYPVHGERDKFQWFVHFSEVVKYEYELPASL